MWVGGGCGWWCGCGGEGVAGGGHPPAGGWVAVCLRVCVCVCLFLCNTLITKGGIDSFGVHYRTFGMWYQERTLSWYLQLLNCGNL